MLKLCREEFGNMEMDYLLPQAEIKVSKKINGRGVFSNKDYKKGELIEVCPCIVDKYSNFHGKMKDYLFKFDEEKSLVAFGYCSLYNHSDNYNALWKILSEDQLKVYAHKDINKGEEIFVSYGEPYWDSRKDKKID